MKLLTAENYHVMPWKNGLGKTTELAVFPAGASTTDFLWRLSLAHVPGSGPFSAFPGVDRTIIQLTGAPMTLRHPVSGRSKTLGLYEPYAFSGDEATTAELSGAGTDFNVMVRRGAWRAHVDVMTLTDADMTAPIEEGETLYLFCVQGRLRVMGTDSCEWILLPEDSVLVGEGLAREVLLASFPEDRAQVILVRLSPEGR